MKLQLTLFAALIALSLSSCRDMLPAGPPNGGTSSDTIAYWTFDGNANDVSGHGRNGILNGTSEYIPDRFGKPSSVELIGASQMSVQSMPNFNDNDSYTFTAWVNISDGGSLLTNYGFGFDSSGFGGILGGCGQIISGVPLETNKWHLVTLAVAAHSSATLYIDSVQVATKAYGNYTGTSDSMLEFVFNMKYDSNNIVKMDNVLFLHYCLNANQVSARFHEGGWYEHRDTTGVQPSDTTNDQWSKGSATGMTNTYAMCFPTVANGYACGIYGTMVATADSGTTWTKLNTSIQDDLFGVSFASQNVGIAVGGNAIPGGVIIRTTDFGQTWSHPWSDPGGHPVNSQVLRDVKFFWSPPANMKPPVAITVGTDSAGHGMILVSSDLGTTWTLVKTTPHALYSIATSDSKHGYATVVGDAGQFFFTTDMGASWIDNSMGTENIRGVSLDPSYGTAYDGVAISDGTSTFWSTDMGKDWAEHPSLPANGLTAVYAAGGPEAWATFGFGGIMKTTNRGVNWTAINNTAGPYATWRCIAARDPHHIAFAGDGGVLYWLTR